MLTHILNWCYRPVVILWMTLRQRRITILFAIVNVADNLCFTGFGAFQVKYASVAPLCRFQNTSLWLISIDFNIWSCAVTRCGQDLNKPILETKLSIIDESSRLQELYYSWNCVYNCNLPKLKCSLGQHQNRWNDTSERICLNLNAICLKLNSVESWILNSLYDTLMSTDRDSSICI